MHCALRRCKSSNSWKGQNLNNRQGGILNAKKEHLLHQQIDKDCTFLQYTTTGWIMYLVQVNVLAAGARVIVYDGSPFQPTPESYIRLMGDLKVTHLGSSPKYFAELQLRKIAPREITDLSNLRLVTSTGMVLSSTLFEWFYDTGFPAHTQLANITGGTDLNAALALGNTMEPLYAGECHGLNTGIAAEVYELVETDGTPVKGRRCALGEPGELVVTKPFPTMPTMFWGPKGAKQYFDSYFERCNRRLDSRRLRHVPPRHQRPRHARPRRRRPQPLRRPLRKLRNLFHPRNALLDGNRRQHLCRPTAAA